MLALIAVACWLAAVWQWVELVRVLPLCVQAVLVVVAFACRYMIVLVCVAVVCWIWCSGSVELC